VPLVLLALAVAFGVMLVFGGAEFDRGLFLFFYLGERPDLAPYARFVTELGGWRVLVPVTAAGALWLLFRRDWAAAGLLLAATLSGRFVVDRAKDWTARLRPEEHEHLVAVQSLAFPSAHAANAALVWFSLALLLPRAGMPRALAVWVAAWLAIAVGASRVLLGVHWPSDVIAGWAFGLFWTLLCFRLSGRALGEGTPRPLAHSSR
jgi:membrane-associated phospholipid phosphatase